MVVRMDVRRLLFFILGMGIAILASLLGPFGTFAIIMVIMFVFPLTNADVMRNIDYVYHEIRNKKQ